MKRNNDNSPDLSGVDWELRDLVTGDSDETITLGADAVHPVAGILDDAIQYPADLRQAQADAATLAIERDLGVRRVEADPSLVTELETQVRSLSEGRPTPVTPWSLARQTDAAHARLQQHEARKASRSHHRQAGDDALQKLAGSTWVKSAAEFSAEVDPASLTTRLLTAAAAGDGAALRQLAREIVVADALATGEL